MDKLGKTRRTNKCGTFRKENINEKATVMGWVQKKRNLGSLVFIDLRDISGLVQVVFDEEWNKGAFDKASEVKSEYVITITGIVRERESKNDNMPTGDIEIHGEEIKILSQSATPPIYVRDNDDASETMRLKNRFLDLRKPFMQNNLIIRAKTAKVIRDFMYENEFLEIETPVLNKPTPEGARDYLVPSRVNKGSFYALPQSPQIFKQLLMVSGYDRYYQIVKCFRDEDLRANRQPEFTQLDMEMSFVGTEDIIAINERLITRIFKEIKNIDIETPIRRMEYDEAMNRYGSDKPDLRFGYEFIDLTHIFIDSEFNAFKSNTEAGRSVKGIMVSGKSDSFSKKAISNLESFVKSYDAKGLAWIKLEGDELNSPIAKFLGENEKSKLVNELDMKDKDMLFLVADTTNVVNNALGALRKKIAENLNEIDENQYELVWITDFPLFEYDAEAKRYVAKHHPFTSPVDDDLDKLESNPDEVRAKAYDIVINGDEIGGGSIRITDRGLQQRMFKALGLTEDEVESKFGFLLNSFKYGVPPHGGIAYGLDRLIMTLTGSTNIRDVIAFPKTQSASCLLSGAPTTVDENQLKELGIKLDVQVN
ncbi:MAG: Aspartyl-tRNA synthetase [Clostridiales bacterium 38_11]|nr:MAG: Aspartyl-tRNA synthetase [Clostridiales bacterium 38_11]HBH12669.1 aspartate--tRNA ligase [Clostridiales bacterium]